MFGYNAHLSPRSKTNGNYVFGLTNILQIKRNKYCGACIERSWEKFLHYESQKLQKITLFLPNIFIEEN